MSNSMQYRPSHCHRNHASNTVEHCTMREEGSSEVQGAGGKQSDRECVRESGEGSGRDMEESGDGGV